jgi:hypothetical protein
MLNRLRNSRISRFMGLDFEAVDIAQARKVLDEPVQVHGGTGYAAATPQYRRRPESERDKRLTPESFEWLHEMPRHERPIQLALQFPRIVNKMADIWHEQKTTEAYLQELLVDHRGNRRGFPVPVIGDLMRLRAYQAKQDGAAH